MNAILFALLLSPSPVHLRLTVPRAGDYRIMGKAANGARGHTVHEAGLRAGRSGLGLGSNARFSTVDMGGHGAEVTLRPRAYTLGRRFVGNVLVNVLRSVLQRDGDCARHYQLLTVG